nr:family 20 glycosylhydrolase [Kibdelosporangium sp. MJ126-NF4]CEL18627.1 Beta-hexosaminidase [Kibdelosporangium sp. MJ126-NF4]CTQ98112.1 Beta-hexosaminidase (EC 3.2.1.52) [Kibdelosporangium sp. MJ126-NF4]
MNRFIAAIAGLLVLIGLVQPVHAEPAGGGGNPVPAVVPGLREWTGGHGHWWLTPVTRIVLDSPALRPVGEQFGSDLTAVTGRRARVVTGSPRPGDLVLSSTGGNSEQYTLDIGHVLRVRGESTAGVVHGAQVVLQMLVLDPRRARVPQGRAKDWPQFAERGQMIDAGRRYYPVPYLESQIRRMAWLRMNVLHLHLTDWNGFRFRTEKFPGLASAESYSKAELRHLQDYARRYGVTIVPEIDLPAHANTITAWKPSLGFACQSMLFPPGQGDTRRGWNLDITKPETRQFVRDLLDEVMDVFDTPYLHIGGDEWPYDNEKRACPELMAYAAAKGYPEPGDVFVEFINEVNQQIRARGRNTRLWQWWDFGGQRTSISPSRDIMIDVWLGGPEGKAAQGYPVTGTEDGKLYVTPGFGTAPGQYGFMPAEDVYQNYPFTVHPNIHGYKVSRWSDHAEQRPVYWMDFFAQRALQVLAQRTWGGPKPDKAADFYRRVDALGEPPSRLTAVPARLVRVDSEELTAENGAGANAFDADPRTLWHSKYTDEVQPPPHEIDADLGGTVRLGGVRYWPRQDHGANGRVSDYEILSSMDGKSWRLAARGTFADEQPAQLVEFTPRPARFLRLRALGEVAGRPYTSVAEITPLQVAER